MTSPSRGSEKSLISPLLPAEDSMFIQKPKILFIYSYMSDKSISLVLKGRYKFCTSTTTTYAQWQQKYLSVKFTTNIFINTFINNFSEKHTKQTENGA